MTVLIEGSAGRSWADQVRSARAAAGMSQRELAERAGLSIRAVRNIESGTVRRPHPRTAALLGRFLALDEPPPLELGDRSGRPELCVLGPISTLSGNRRRGLSSPALRTVLALLALRRGRAVTVDEMVDRLWPDDPPRTNRSLVQGHVARVRSLFPDGDAVRRSGDGYLLDDAVRTDVGRFEHLSAVGARLRSAGDPHGAVDTLLAALELWAGPVAADAGAEVRVLACVAALDARRAEVARLLGAAALDTGRVEEVIFAVLGAQAAEPYDEPLAATSVRLLQHSGRQVQAQGLFVRVRRTLRDELGVAPGPELAAAAPETERDVRGAPDALPARSMMLVEVPVLLPPAPALITGREPELAVLDSVLAASAGGGTRVVAVSGPPGMGKSALAAHWAHLRRARFPDGQLHADLRTHAPGGHRPHAAQVLRMFLGALGVPPRDLPRTAAELSAKFRQLTVDRRVLVVLDDAADAAQVRPLLPAGGHSLVVVTARAQLLDLVADGAHPLTIGPLPPAAARTVLARRLGAASVRATGDTVGRALRGTGGVPLLLHMLGAWAALSPATSLAALVEDMLANGIVRLCGTGMDVERSVEASFRRLSPEGLDLLGGLAAGAVTAETARVHGGLDELHRAGMVLIAGQGRVIVPEPVRSFILRRRIGPSGLREKVVDHP